MTSRRPVLAAALALAGCAATVVFTGAATGAEAPAKTTVPPGPGPVPTVAVPTAPATTLSPATTAPAPTVAPPTVAPVTTSGPTAPVSTFAPPPTTLGAPFDGTTFFRDFYSRLGLAPPDALELVEQVAIGTTADAFLFHEVGAAVAVYVHSTAPLPAYTVTPQGAGVSVCRDDGTCEQFADLALEAGALSTFSIDGQPMADRVSGYERPTTVEAFTVDGVYAVRRPRLEALSIVVLISSEGGGTTIAWDQTNYLDVSGRPYALDPAATRAPARLEDGDATVAHIVVPGAQHGGQLVVSITTDLTGVPATIRIPVTISA